MKCHICKEDKLSKEFPFHPLTESCNHPLLHCLDCSIASVKNHNKCSHCDSTVTENNTRYKEYLKILTFLFPNEEDIDQEDYSISEMDFEEGDIQGDINVTTLSGVSETFAFQPNKKIKDLKNEVEEKFEIPPNKQRLLYQDKELQLKDDMKELTLEDFKIPPNSTLYLIIKLCDVPDDLENLVFDFCWGLPRRQQKDYLDVSVFIYSGQLHVGTILWKDRSISDCPGVTHSGPADMDYTKGEGRHRVDIALKSVPPRVDKIVFTLSAWRSSSASAYPFRKLRFYDVDFPDQELCSDDMNGLLHKESIIMCNLSRKNDKWSVIEVKCGADGCTKPNSLRPLQEKIEELIRCKKIN